MTTFSDYIVYVDESGDHSLVSIGKDYPIFVLAFCIIRKSDYVDSITPAIQRLKFKFFGHDMVILHEHEIRKATEPFSFLVNATMRQSFMEDLNRIVNDAPFTLIASAIRKDHYVAQYADPDNPYDIALKFCLERAYMFMKGVSQHNQKTHIIVESRGSKEDRNLELAFRRICQGANYLGVDLPFSIEFADKKRNSSGLQLADLIARPIGRNLLNPQQGNIAYDIIKPKFRKSPEGKIEGWGLKCFP